MYGNLFKYVFIIFLAALSSCKKGNDLPAGSAETQIKSFSITGYQQQVTISPYGQFISIRLADTVSTASSLIADFSLSTGATAYVKNVAQQPGVSVNDFEGNIIYNVVAENKSSSQPWTISATNNDYTYDWGMGNILKKAKTNDRPYSWYIDQKETGTYSNVNCGPSVVTMALKWVDASFTKTAEDARAAYNPAGGWWYTNDISNYLHDNHALSVTIPLQAFNQEDAWTKISQQLDYGRLVILCLDMHPVVGDYVAYHHTNKFYTTTPGFGHFLLIKGYRTVDKQHYFEIYDPNSWGQRYDNGNYKGKDRYYDYKTLTSGFSNWWPYAIIVAPAGDPLNPGTFRQSVDPTLIPQGRGK